MNVIPISPLDLGVAALLVVALAGLSMRLRLKVERQVSVAAARTVLQLFAVGLVLKWLFEQAGPFWVVCMALLMVGLAGWEVMRRQRRPFSGSWGYGIGAGAMLCTSFTLTFFALSGVIGVEPWYAPRYAIPILGMVLGNTMNGVALGVDRLTQGASDRRGAIEARLMLGATAAEACRGLRAESVRTGLIPIVNSMAAAGLISLPGMMTGQILAGSPPTEAVKYQILIMFLVSSGTGFGAVLAVWIGARRLFDERQRLRLDRLVAPRAGA